MKSRLRHSSAEVRQAGRFKPTRNTQENGKPVHRVVCILTIWFRGKRSQDNDRKHCTSGKGVSVDRHRPIGHGS